MEIRTAAPVIPDHDVLRCIGKGSYGEVWLARAVTGTLRAVKVVRREDFELDRTFEREFEGIMKFEPVSRDHSGLVHILHVGRNDEEKFYYYVMELGDDKERGSRAEAADYEARTLGTDKVLKQRLPVTDCIGHGVQVAEGLAHLHECGLTHRDIKPSNIIFVNGKAKLADIGLVAAAGQMTFVGTEGFVPPEGPGTKLADIYSLGMVLYEVSTGKDRLQYPELPDDPGEARNRAQRLALNDVILKACALQPKKRYQSARELADALRAAARKKPKGAPWLGRLLLLPFVTAAAAFLIVTWQHHGAMPWPPGRFAIGEGIAPPPPSRDGFVLLESSPSSAEVIWKGKTIGRTPLKASVPAGDATFILRRKKYRDYDLLVTGVESGLKKVVDPVVLLFEPPLAGQTWTNSLDILFDPVMNGHLSRRAVDYDRFVKVQEIVSGRTIEEKTGPNELLYMVSIPMADALRFCDELTQRETMDGHLTSDLCYRPEPYTPKDPAKARMIKPGEICFRLAIEKYGSITISSDPSGAEVYEGLQRRGTTPWQDFRHRTGPIEFRLSLPGYLNSTVTGTLPSGGSLVLTTTLKKSKLAVFGKDWENGQEVPFRPIGPDILVAAWETRVKDYAAFAAATNTPLRVPAPDKTTGATAHQGPDHPVINITRADARKYCQWLTTTERGLGFIDPTMEYRLPSDAQWSLAAGAPDLEEFPRTPYQRHLTVSGVYPWTPRPQFPPPPGRPGNSSTQAVKAAGNYGDLSALKANALGTLKPWQAKAIENLAYDDGMPYTAPVDRFAPTTSGVCDLGGNVWELVEDDYGGGKTPELVTYAVVRGGAWNTLAIEREELATQFRKAIPADEFAENCGFRIVLTSLLPANPAPIPAPAPAPVAPGATIYPNLPFNVFPGQAPLGPDPIPAKDTD